MNPIANAPIQETEVGTLQPHHFYSDKFRMDKFVNKTTGKFDYVSVFCLNNKDLSPVYKGYDGEFCHSCFAGYTHSTNEHFDSVKKCKP